MEEQTGATVESPTATETDEQSASSAEAPAAAPAQQAVQEKPEAPFHEHPRWKEMMAERDYLRQQLAVANGRPVATPVPAPVEQDPYVGMTPEEKNFYQQLDQRVEKRALKIADEREAKVLKEINENRHIMASIAYERFQTRHPDVVSDSPEETAIANLYSRGYTLDDAYKVVMFDKLQREKATAAKTVQTQKVQQKAAANVETSTIPASSGLPQKQFKSMREFVDDQIRKGEYVV